MVSFAVLAITRCRDIKVMIFKRKKSEKEYEKYLVIFDSIVKRIIISDIGVEEENENWKSARKTFQLDFRAEQENTRLHCKGCIELKQKQEEKLKYRDQKKVRKRLRCFKNVEKQ